MATEFPLAQVIVGKDDVEKNQQHHVVKPDLHCDENVQHGPSAIPRREEPWMHMFPRSGVLPRGTVKRLESDVDIEKRPPGLTMVDDDDERLGVDVELIWTISMSKKMEVATGLCPMSRPS
ncbi:UNVERIFIED_CONTAM: hypothetical protein K2H54_038238 [Gekko kuhli]